MKAFGDMGHLARLRPVNICDRIGNVGHEGLCGYGPLLYGILLIGAGCGRVMLI